MTESKQTTHPWTIIVLTMIGIGLGTAVALLTDDVIIGVIAGAGFIALTVQTVKAWTRHAT
jgi:hypothetical protein